METNEEEILPLRGHPGMLSSPVLGRGRGDGDEEDRGEGSLADGQTERYEAYRSVYKVWKERVLKRQGINEGDGPEDRQIGGSKQICMATGKRFVVFISWPGTLHPQPLIPPAVSCQGDCSLRKSISSGTRARTLWCSPLTLFDFV
jgi:hypothetical protein